MNITFADAIRDFFRRYATFSGRSSRSQYWFVVLALVILNIFISVPMILVPFAMFGVPALGLGLMVVANIVVFGIAIAILIPSLALTVRRLHDIGRSGVWLVIFLLLPMLAGLILVLAMQNNYNTAGIIFSMAILPIAGIWGLIWMCTPGDVGENEYGPDPIEMAAAEKAAKLNPYQQYPYPQNPYQQNPYQQNQYPQNQYPQNPYSQNPYQGNGWQRGDYNPNNGGGYGN